MTKSQDAVRPHRILAFQQLAAIREANGVKLPPNRLNCGGGYIREGVMNAEPPKNVSKERKMMLLKFMTFTATAIRMQSAARSNTRQVDTGIRAGRGQSPAVQGLTTAYRSITRSLSRTVPATCMNFRWSPRLNASSLVMARERGVDYQYR